MQAHEPQSPLNHTHKHLDGYGKWNKLNQMNFKRNTFGGKIIKLQMKRAVSGALTAAHSAQRYLSC